MRPFREVGTSKQLEVLEPEKTEVAPPFHERTLSPRSCHVPAWNSQAKFSFHTRTQVFAEKVFCRVVTVSVVF